MFQFILVLHTLLCLLLIGLVLLQQGKGADMGATFGGGGSNTLFGAAGAASFITKLTTGTCVLFMITSILLVRSYSQRGYITTGPSDPLAGSVMEGVSEPAQSEAAKESAAAPAGVAPLDMPPPPAAKVAAPPPPEGPPAAAENKRAPEPPAPMNVAPKPQS